MRKTGAAVGVVAASPLLFGAPVLLAAAADTATCSAQQAPDIDAAAVAHQVRAVLDGRGDADVSIPGLDDPAEQIPNAEVVQAAGVAMQVTTRGQVIALVTALQESRLRNVGYGDRDSLGLFQQRPSQGWGTAGQILDPAYASRSFYRHLLGIRGWQSMTVAQAAQAVQHSGYPDAYARWEPLASALQQALTQQAGTGRPDERRSPEAGAIAGCAPGDARRFGPIPAGALPEGYEIPKTAPRKVRTAIRWALGQLGTPYQWGGSCTDAHGPDPMRRCDCSSLMQQAYKAGGVRLARTTYTQVKAGKPVALNALEPGDLLFTEGTAAAPEHVGAYIGSGLVVHAPHPMDVVRVAPLDEWLPEIVAARRVV